MKDDDRQRAKTMIILRGIAKYGVIGLSLLMTVHCGMLWAGRDDILVHISLCVFAMFLGMYLNRVFKLCWAHRLCVHYIVMVLVCQVLKRHHVFMRCGIDIQDARLVMMVVGIVVTSIALWKGRRNC